MLRIKTSYRNVIFLKMGSPKRAQIYGVYTCTCTSTATEAVYVYMHVDVQ